MPAGILRIIMFSLSDRTIVIIIRYTDRNTNVQEGGMGHIYIEIETNTYTLTKFIFCK